MGRHVSVPENPRSARVACAGLAVVLLAGVLTVAGIATAASNLTGYYAPFIGHGGADVNHDGVVNDLDDSAGFFRDTDLIDGHLDCNAWGTLVTDVNDGTAGNGEITDADDCILQGYRSKDVETFIYVVDGLFAYTASTFSGSRTPIPTGWRMPSAYDDGTSFDLSSNDYETAQWAWVADSGFVDYDHDGTPNETPSTDDDATNFLPLGIDVIDGWVDVDNDGVVDDSGDDCSNGCFFGLNVSNGKVQSGSVSDPFAALTGPAGPAGKDGKDGVSGRVSVSSTSSLNSLNKARTASCSSTTKVLGGGYSLAGDTATLAHLTVVANGPVPGGWQVRVIEATPTSGTWSITVTAVCAIA